jgi:uncharacterized protein (TIGR03067 family)
MKSLFHDFLVAGLIGAASCLIAANARQENPAQRDQDNLQGYWKSVATKGYGKDVPNEELKTLYLTFKGKHIFAKYGEKTAEATYKLILTEAGPSQIDFAVTQGPEAVQGKTVQGIYLLEGDTLKILYRDPGKPRPATFMDENKPGVYMVFLKKEKT